MRGVWGAQAVKHLPSAQVMISEPQGGAPHQVLSGQSVTFFLSLCHFLPAHSFSLSLSPSRKWINCFKKKNLPCEILPQPWLFFQQNLCFYSPFHTTQRSVDLASVQSPHPIPSRPWGTGHSLLPSGSTMNCGQCTLRTNAECQAHAHDQTPSRQQDMNYHLPWQ